MTGFMFDVHVDSYFAALGSFCIGPWIFASTHLPWPDFDEPADFCWVIVFSAQSVSLNNNAMITLIFRGNPHWELGNPHEATPIRWEDHLDRRGFSSRASLQPWLKHFPKRTSTTWAIWEYVLFSLGPEANHLWFVFSLKHKNYTSISPAQGESKLWTLGGYCSFRHDQKRTSGLGVIPLCCMDSLIFPRHHSGLPLVVTNGLLWKAIIFNRMLMYKGFSSIIAIYIVCWRGRNYPPINMFHRETRLVLTDCIHYQHTMLWELG